MANLRSALSLFVLFAVASAAVISSNDAAVVVRDATSLDVSVPKSPLFLDNSVLVSDANERIVLAAFATNSAIAVAACTFGGPIACISVGVAAVLSTFWGLYKASSDGPMMELNTGRTLTLTHPQWQPTAECNVACQLQAGVEPETWTPFANVTVDGAEHVLHYFRSGNTNGLKAVPVTNASADATRRSDIDDAGGIVASYFWDDGNQNAWKAWNSGADSSIESQVSNYIIGGDYEVICVDLEDAAGNLDAGVMTIGTDNTAIILSPSQLPLYLNSCAAGE